MSNKLPSLLQRIEESLPSQSAAVQIETQAKNSYSSVIKLFERLKRHCSEEDYDELKKRFLNSLKNDDYRKFDRGYQRIFYAADEDTLNLIDRE